MAGWGAIETEMVPQEETLACLKVRHDRRSTGFGNGGRSMNRPNGRGECKGEAEFAYVARENCSFCQFGIGGSFQMTTGLRSILRDE